LGGGVKIEYLAQNAKWGDRDSQVSENQTGVLAKKVLLEPSRKKQRAEKTARDSLPKKFTSHRQSRPQGGTLPLS